MCFSIENEGKGVRGEIATGGREPTRSEEESVGAPEKLIIGPRIDIGRGRAGKRKESGLLNRKNRRGRWRRAIER